MLLARISESFPRPEPHPSCPRSQVEGRMGMAEVEGSVPDIINVIWLFSVRAGKVSIRASGIVLMLLARRDNSSESCPRPEPRPSCPRPQAEGRMGVAEAEGRIPGVSSRGSSINNVILLSFCQSGQD